MTEQDKFGPLPEPDVVALSDYFDAAGQKHSLAYTADQMHAYAAQAVAAERERWRKTVEALLPMAEESLVRPELDITCLDARGLLSGPNPKRP